MQTWDFKKWQEKGCIQHNKPDMAAQKQTLMQYTQFTESAHTARHLQEERKIAPRLQESAVDHRKHSRNDSNEWPAIRPWRRPGISYAYGVLGPEYEYQAPTTRCAGKIPLITFFDLIISLHFI